MFFFLELFNELEIESLSNLRILDIGCNQGFWSVLLSRLGAINVDGIDGSKQNIDLANNLQETLGIYNVDFKQSILEEYSSNSYDICCFINVLYHLSEPDVAFKKLRELTGGYLLLVSKISDKIIHKIDTPRGYNYDNQNSITPTLKMIQDGLVTCGFNTIKIINNDYSYLKDQFSGNPWVTIIAN